VLIRDNGKATSTLEIHAPAENHLPSASNTSKQDMSQHLKHFI
jgi:hypothetical protein